MDVFSHLVAEGRPPLWQAALHAAHELGVFAVLAGGPASPAALGTALGVAPRRLRALLDVLALEGALVSDGGSYRLGVVPPPPPPPPPAGWGRLADVLRADRPLDADAGFGDTGEACRRYHHYLGEAGAEPARRLMEHLGRALPEGAALLDIGAGIGTYAAAWLADGPDRRATLVDREEVLELARAELAASGGRARFVPGDFLDAPVPGVHHVALLCNVLHLHGPKDCARLVERAARSVVPGGEVVVKDLRIDADRRGPAIGVYFALNMALFTPAGDVYDEGRITAWLAAAGLTVTTEALPGLPDALVVRGRRGAAPGHPGA